MKASTSQFGFINSSPLLQDTFLCSPQPRLIFMQHLSWPVPFPRLAKCFEVAFLLHLLLLQAQGCAAQKPQHQLGVPQCHGFWALQLPFRQAQTTPLFPAPGGTGPGFARGLARVCAWRVGTWGRARLRCLVPAPQTAGDGAEKAVLRQKPGFYSSILFSSTQPD